MYTSGTTSEPKGVLISNETVVTVVSGINFSLKSINEELFQDDVYLSYLPLAHIFDRVVEELFISIGASIGYWRGDVKLLAEDIKDLKPTLLCSVPRVLERIYSGLMEKISSSGALKRTLFNAAYSYKLSNLNKGYKHEEASPLFDKIVFSKIKEGLGGKLRLILSEGALLAPSVETFLRCFVVIALYEKSILCSTLLQVLPKAVQLHSLHNLMLWQ